MKKLFWCVIFLLLAVLTGIFIFKNKIAAYLISKTKSKIENKYRIAINYEEINLTGFSEIHFSKVQIIPKGCDTLLQCPDIDINYSFWALMKKQFVINTLSFKRIDVNIVKTSKCNNLAFLFTKRDSLAPGGNRIGLEELFKTSSQALFNLLPQNFSSDLINVKIATDSLQQSITISNLKINDDKISGLLRENESEMPYTLEGSFIKEERSVRLRILNPLRKAPDFTIKLANVYSNFEELVIDCSVPETDTVSLLAKFDVKKFACYHRRIAADTVRIEKLNFDFKTVFIGNKFIVDSSSVFGLNKVNTSVFFAVDYQKPRRYDLKLSIANCDAHDFFGSLPNSMFANLEGFDASGTMHYQLEFSLSDVNPDSCTFSSNLSADNLSIKNYGKGNINKLNGPFTHQVFENDRLVKTIEVGPLNPDYYTLEYISPFLKNAILTSEDGSFFWHKGFNENAFRKSIAENYKAKKFVRGGSTISMQLIKNVFLNRKKNVARKLEEVLIVWLIENKRLASKEKMFEVYLNIIEFGPDIYGIGPAAKYYFNKKPVMLTLAESIFLSSILPRPKYFKYNFDNYGNLKPFLADYYRVVANFLRHKNLITENEYNDLKPDIDITGEAAKLLQHNDSVPEDFMERTLKVE